MRVSRWYVSVVLSPASSDRPETHIAAVAEVKERLRRRGADVVDIDGVRVRTEDGWWLMRASNTQAVVVVRAESSSPAGLERLKQQLAAELKPSGLTLPE